MKIKIMLFSLAILLMVQCSARKTPEKPPLAPVDPVEDEYFGKKISDPYRYMENLKDPVVQKWFKSQTDYSRSVLNSISGRQSLIDKMRDFDERRSSRISKLIITEDNRYFYLKITPSDEKAKLYFRDGYEGEESLLYDLDTFSSDTTKKIFSNSPSPDGSKVAFHISPKGPLLIMDVENKKLYPEQIDRWIIELIFWLPDGSGFLYSGYQPSDGHNKDSGKNNYGMYLHIVGTDPIADREIFSKEKYPELGIKSEDGYLVFYDKYSHYLVGFVGGNVFCAPATELNKEKIAWKYLFNRRKDEVSLSGWVAGGITIENDLYIRTSKNAPNFKVIKISLKKPDLAKAEVVVPENSQATLTSFKLTSEGMYYTLVKNGIQAKLYHLPYGTKKAVELVPPFAAGSISLSTKGYKFSDVWVSISGWTSDSQRYRYLTDKNEFKLENLSDVAEYPEYSNLIAEEVMVESHDGVKVPLSLVYKKGIRKNGNNPVLIYGYGGHGDSVSPRFDPISRLLWTLEGGIYAVAHVRGGGELGEQWHKAGKKSTKPNTWKDLIACAEYLVTEKYTSPKKIAIYSLSAGGILVGRAMTERPDLFAAVISRVGIMNPLRFEETDNGRDNVHEYGTVKDTIECMALIEMDSYLQLKDGVKYPATLVTAGMTDRKVVPWQSGKFAARLQAANASDNPILFWVDYESRHGSGFTKSKQFESLADILSFALWQTGNPKFQIK
jgi:prolyl oligopeptidase